MAQHFLHFFKNHKMRPIFYLLLIQLFFTGIAAFAGNNSVDPDEEKIYRLALQSIIEKEKNDRGHGFILNSMTLVNENDLNSITKQLPTLKQQTLEDFISKNKESQKIERLGGNLPYELKEFDELEKIIKREDTNAKAMNSIYPRIPYHVTIICFSKVGFSKNKDQAFVYVFDMNKALESIWTSRSGYLFKKVKGRWVLEKTAVGFGSVSEFR